MRESREGNTWTVTFDSATEYYERAINGASDMEARRQSRVNRKSEHWDLDAGWHGTTQLVKYGWPEGMEAVKGMRNRLVARVSERNASVMRPAFTRDLVGGAPDVVRFLSGRPDCMVTRKPVRLDTPVVRMRVDTGASSMVDAKSMQRRGAAALALVELLEMTGRRVEIAIGQAAIGGRGRVDVLAVVKRPEAPAQMDQLAFLLTHPATHRRLGFSFREQAPADIREQIGVPGMYGMSVQSEQWADANVIMPPIVSERWQDSEAEAWIIEQLKAQGVEVKA